MRGYYVKKATNDDDDHSKDVPNFLDFGFDHVYHQLNLSEDPSKNSSKPDSVSSEDVKNGQEWYTSQLSTYKQGTTTDGPEDINPNYNTLHTFRDKANNNIYTLGYMQACGTPLTTKNSNIKSNTLTNTIDKASWGYKSKNKDNSSSLERWRPYSFFVSPFNKNPLTSGSDNKNVPAVNNNAYHPYGLVSVQSVQTSSSSFGSGITTWNTTNKATSGHVTNKDNVDYYNTANWTENVVEHSRPANQKNFSSVDNNGTYKISDYGVYYFNASVNPSGVYTGSITYFSTYKSNGTVVENIFLITILMSVIILLFYLIFKYRLIGILVSMFTGILILYDFRSINELSAKYNEALASIFILGLAFFLISVSMIISGMRKRYIAYEKRNPENKSIYSRGLIKNFIDIFFVVFFSAYLILINKNSGLLQGQATLIATQVIAIFGLVIFLFRFLLLTLLINPNYKKFDKYLFRFNNKKKYSFKEKEIDIQGPNQEIKQRDLLMNNINNEIIHDTNFKLKENKPKNNPASMHIINKHNPFNNFWVWFKTIFSSFKIIERKKYQKIFNNEINLKSVNKVYRGNNTNKNKFFSSWVLFTRWMFPSIFLILTIISVVGISLNLSGINANIVRFDNRAQNQNDDFITISPNVREFFIDAAAGFRPNLNPNPNNKITISYHTDDGSTAGDTPGNYVALCNYSLENDSKLTIPPLLAKFMESTNILKKQIKLFTNDLHLIYHDTNTYVESNNRKSALLEKGFSFKGYYINYNMKWRKSWKIFFCTTIRQ